jgi:hypothetical protein
MTRKGKWTDRNREDGGNRFDGFGVGDGYAGECVCRRIFSLSFLRKQESRGEGKGGFLSREAVQKSIGFRIR